MSAAVRVFVAVRIRPSPPLVGVLDELSALGQAVKPVAAENLHVTLKFLGNTDASWLTEIEHTLSDVASRTPAFRVTLRGLGAFPKPSQPSTIWAGITPPKPMNQLADVVEQALVEFGFAPETRAFHPHVTLARIKSRPPNELPSMLDRHTETVFATIDVSEIVLMQSELASQGPVYMPLHVARLL